MLLFMGFFSGIPKELEEAARMDGAGMYGFYGQDTTDWTGLAAAACISVIPIVVVFLFLQRTFVEGIAGAVKS